MLCYIRNKLFIYYTWVCILQITSCLVVDVSETRLEVRHVCSFYFYENSVSDFADVCDVIFRLMKAGLCGAVPQLCVIRE